VTADKVTSLGGCDIRYVDRKTLKTYEKGTRFDEVVEVVEETIQHRIEGLGTALGNEVGTERMELAILPLNCNA
jgi:hypothetical protein